MVPDRPGATGLLLSTIVLMYLLMYRMVSLRLLVRAANLILHLIYLLFRK